MERSSDIHFPAEAVLENRDKGALRGVNLDYGTQGASLVNATWLAIGRSVEKYFL